jgi:hypothetical protein
MGTTAKLFPPEADCRMFSLGLRICASSDRTSGGQESAYSGSGQLGQSSADGHLRRLRSQVLL